MQMKKYTYRGLIGLAAASLFATQAFATVCPTAPHSPGLQTKGSPVCVAPYGQDGSTTGLSSVLAPYDATTNPHGIFTQGSPSVDPYTQQAQMPYWSVGGSSGSVSTILMQIAGNSNGYTFGIFDPTNYTNKLDIFTAAGNGAQAMLSVGTGGHYWVGSHDAYFGVSNKFGYFLTDPGKNGKTFYSLPSLNETSPAYSHGTPHMVAYQGGNGGSIRPMNGLDGGTWQKNEYIQAWEDLPYMSSDLDYNDFIVMTESVQPVPEPAALGMFGLGLLLIGGFAGLRLRRRNIA